MSKNYIKEENGLSSFNAAQEGMCIHIGKEKSIFFSCPIDKSDYGSLSFVGKKIERTLLDSIPFTNNSVYIVRQELYERIKDLPEINQLDLTFLISSRPRLSYALISKLLYDLLDSNCQSGKIAKTAMVHATAQVHPSANIGEDTVVSAGVVIGARVTIGDRCLISENCVIGGQGFGFERNENGLPIRIYHLGGVDISNSVEIGANSCVDSATLSSEKTAIGDYTKIDNLVHVAHNVKIEQSCLIAKGSCLCGSSSIGKNSWLGPNSVVHSSVVVAPDSTIGALANVTHSNTYITVSGPLMYSMRNIARLKKILH